MPVTTVYAYRGGSAAAGIKIMLSFSGGGVTPDVRTDGSGKAVIHHTASGTATLFVNGQKRQTLRAPTEISVEV